jgi:BirA family transcriptional regulator, biotin operon repressor / biotin---[acetyl-CoA-carboxylase] ligase
MQQNIQSFTIGEPFIQLNSVLSTNSYAIEQIQANLAAPGSAYFAFEQTAGRGQREKKWETEAGSNIITSVALPCNSFLLHEQFAISVISALACRQLFNNYATSSTTIKWPNDIYWNDRKAAGILIENLVNGHQWNWSVIGMGININQSKFSDLAQKAVSLLQITGKQYHILTLAQELYAILQQYFNKLIANNFQALLQEYNEHLFMLEKNVKLKQGNKVFNATIKGVNKYGQLITFTNIEELFDFGEVEWIL